MQISPDTNPYKALIFICLFVAKQKFKQILFQQLRLLIFLLERSNVVIV